MFGHDINALLACEIAVSHKSQMETYIILFLSHVSHKKAGTVPYFLWGTLVKGKAGMHSSPIHFNEIASYS